MTGDAHSHFPPRIAVTPLADLLAQRKALDEKISALRASGRVAAIKTVRALMLESGLSVDDLGLREAVAKVRNQANSPRFGTKVPAKYRDKHGNAWSGRGLRPRWLTAALAAGAALEDFAIGAVDTADVEHPSAQ